MDERDKKTELLVGIFLTVGLALLGLLILQFGSVREYFKDTYEITVPFPDATGVKVGTPIMLGGSKIGKVPRMPRLNEHFNGVIVPLEIYKDKRVPADAKFTVGTAGLLGDAFIEIRPTGEKTTAYIEPGASLTDDNVQKSSGLGALQSTAQDIGKKVDVALEDIREAVADLRVSLKKINEGALTDRALADFRESMEHLNATMKRMDDKVLGDENAANLKAAIADIKDAATTFKTSAKNVEDSTKKLGPMFDKLDPAVAKADKVMSSAEDALKSVKTGAENFSAATKKLNSGDGLLGSLMSDRELRTDFKATIADLRDVAANVKKSGFLWYKNVADKEREKQQAQQQGQSPAGQSAVQTAAPKSESSSKRSSPFRKPGR
ncbi:MAG: MlaD family protein [Verrucomicrobiaceae bacterium]|nr:MlaD family protein [Verrucomicrobiaceae bacterium]